MILTLLGVTLLAGGLPVIVANLLPPSAVFGDHPGYAICRIGIGAAVSSSGLLFLA